MGSGKFSVLCTHVPLNGNMYLFECFFFFQNKMCFCCVSIPGMFVSYAWACFLCLICWHICLCPKYGHACLCTYLWTYLFYVLHVDIFLYVLNVDMFVYLSYVWMFVLYVDLFICLMCEHTCLICGCVIYVF